MNQSRPESIQMPTEEETGHTLGPCLACQRAARVADRWDQMRPDPS